MFVGKTLTNLRILRGYNRKQLAQVLGVTEQAVWQYENGYAAPKLGTINDLKRLFSVKSRFFYQEDLLSKQSKNYVNHNHIAYRADERNSVQKTQMEKVHLEYSIAFLNLLSNHFQLPENNMRKLRDEVLYLMRTSSNELEEIKLYAHYARDFLGISSINNKNILYHLEKNGVFVFEKAVGEKVDAYSVWSEDDMPYIMLGNSKGVAARRNFDLAHELGHLLMHYKEEFALQDKSNHNIFEQQADIFAGEFLLPEREIRKDLEALNRISNPDSYLDLKKKWEVSIQALGYRARDLGIMSEQQFRYFYAQINKMGYRKLEPLDKEIPLQRPGKIKSILQFLFENKVIKLENILSSLELEEEFLSVLTGIDKDFFKKYKEHTSRTYSIADFKQENINFGN
ncbi:helix-turn-helix domain-containing protein [Alkalicoccus halolimnae]|uniref:XRE family transcriptional regulator n=1 Tax=Alkalicoccus halolimnae TaxID=1667239 RepID=A0A5C7F6A4_9BACI|nr:XRE family transcriptional regulator [Alkalicoccus halolimnae]TXF86212.1 ImmA/IrrE family metallo-endopeptidase [Alkalicoccus halolimnae]